MYKNGRTFFIYASVWLQERFLSVVAELFWHMVEEYSLCLLVLLSEGVGGHSRIHADVSSVSVLADHRRLELTGD